MTARTTGLRRRRHSRGRGEGQVLVLFALALVTMLAMAGLLVDGGRAWSDHRIAQNAADTAALAAARAISVGDGTYAARGRDVAQVNGFATDLLTCAGTTQTDMGVEVRYPPVTGPHAGDSSYVAVVVTRRMPTTFSAVIGQGCWLISARAVAQTTPASPTGPAILALGTACGASTSGIHWNGHNTEVLSGDVVSNADIDMPGSGTVDPPNVMTYRSPPCNWYPHGNPVGMATPVTTTYADPFTYTLADFHCQPGPLPAKLTLPVDTNDNVIPSGTYCATDSITTVSSKSGTLTGTVTFIAPQITFNADPQTLRPYENGVLAWATGNASSAVNFKAEGDWGGIIYAPNGGIHVISKANIVVQGALWGMSVDMGGDDWKIQGPTASVGSSAIVKLVE
jgi:Flp pilus assembly protein TadG